MDKKITEELIKKEMNEIREEDLQNRLRKMYQEREKIKDKKELNEKMKTLLSDLELRIKIYEEKIPLRVVERARRSGGVYKTSEEISNSVKNENYSIENEER